MKWEELENFTDAFGINKIPFSDYAINIIEGDFSDISTFKIALLFITDDMTLVGSLGNKLVLAFGNKSSELISNKPIDTFMLKTDDDIMIISFKKT